MATVQERLTAAEDAYHQIMIGRSVVELRDQNGETIRYTPANASRLASYIQELKRQLGQVTTAPAGIIV